jgi:hypothetical protein
VPVYPENDQSAEVLARLHAELFTVGFVDGAASDEQRYRIVGSKRALDFSEQDSEGTYRADASVSPADLLLLRARQALRAEEADEAARVLATLRAGIAALQGALDSPTRNEADLQRVLETYPILFGLEYRAMHSKHRLGKNYEADYALERHSGAIDLVEIEASTHSLYTKANNPSAALVHAEQQVLDWLEWVEQFSGYAQSDLRGLSSPVAFVVIGRSASLDEAARARLRHRNQTWRGSVSVLTFDDLLHRATGMLAVLTDVRTDQVSESLDRSASAISNPLEKVPQLHRRRGRSNAPWS